MDASAKPAPLARTSEVEDPVQLIDAYREHGAYITRLGFRLLGNRTEADDLTQDVFLQAHRAWASLREPGALKGWLATIAVRKATVRLRRRRLRSFLPLSESSAISDTPVLALEAREHLRQVYAELEMLPVKERIAWTLRVVEGQSLQQVAASTEVSLATAKRRIKAAHEKLRPVGDL